MSNNEKKIKYRRLSKKRQDIKFSVNTARCYRGLYFYCDEFIGDFESSGRVSLKYRISAKDNICLNNHTVFEQFVFPTDAYLEMLVVACRTHFNIDAMMFNNIVMMNPLTGGETLTNIVTITFQKDGNGLRFTVRSNRNIEFGDNRDIIHIRGALRPVEKQGNTLAKYLPDLSIKDAKQFSINEFYSKDSTIVLGEFYRSLKTLTFGETQSIAKIETDTKDNRFLLHPSVVSAALANAMSYGPYRLNDTHNIGADIFLPYKIDGMSVLGTITGKNFISLAEIREINENWIELYLEVIDENNNAIFIIETLRLQRVKPDNYKTAKETHIITNKKLTATTPAKIFNEDNQYMDIAVIGMSCRFPMSNNVEEFWDVLKNGNDCITEIPEDRWKEFDHWYSPDPGHQHTSYTKWGGFIDDVDKFDPLFFNISPSEAELMDPQQRIFLEESWRTIENAGYSPGALNSQKCGVFVGCTTGDYDRLLALSGEDTNGQSFMGTSNAILAARISYILNLKGPSLSIDTACSSSLTAIHLACMSIRNGESDLAIAGGVSIFSTPLVHILTSRVRMQSVDGRCFTFDKSANGTVFSEGCGVVMVKPLAQAEQDRDNIIGVIKGSGINQDGKTNGITAPGSKSQESLLRNIYKKYKINPEDITYVEAHGTATPLGDPIEFQALTNAFRHTAKRKQYCAIGSVKSNIGHGSYAAGVAGFIKTLLCMKHNQYVPTVHFREANDIIDFEQSPFFVSTNYEHWPEPECGKRLAAISSFGFSGANAHVVLEDYKERDYNDKTDNNKLSVGGKNTASVIIPLSAKNRERLREVASNLSGYLKVCVSGNTSDIPKLSEIAYTLQVGRDCMSERVAFVVHSASELLQKLDKFSSKENESSIGNCYQGNVKNNKSASCSRKGVVTEELLSSWIREGMTEKYLDLWANGMPVDWNILYDDERPNKITLPSYPFAKERYWVSPPEISKNTVSPDERGSFFVIHPLVQINQSDLFSQTYYSIFDGSEYFFNKKTSSPLSVMVDMVFPEMARVAIMAALGDSYQHINIDLNNTTWIEGVIIGEDPIRLYIDLHEFEFDSDNSFKSVNYTIYSVNSDKPGNVVHARGAGSLKSRISPESINIAILLENMGNISFNSERCDEIYELLNLECVPGNLGMQTLFPGDGQAVVRHNLPDELSTGNDEYILHPSLLTLVCKTAAAVVKGISNVAENEIKTEESKKKLPDDLFLMAESHSVSVEKIEIFTPPRGTLYTWIRFNKDGSSCGNTFKMDISLCDEQGHIHVEITGYEIGIYLSDHCPDSGHDDSAGKLLSTMMMATNKRLDSGENILARPDISPIKYGGTYLMACECEGLGSLLAKYLNCSGAKKLVLVINSTLIDSFRHELKSLETLSIDIQYISVDSLQPSSIKEVLVSTNNMDSEINGIFYTGITSNDSLVNNVEMESRPLSATTLFDNLYMSSDFSHKHPDFVCNFLFSENMVKQQFTGSDNQGIYRAAKITSLDEFQGKNITCGKSVVVDWVVEIIDKSTASMDECNTLLYSDIDFMEKVVTQALLQDDECSITIIDQGQTLKIHRFLDEFPENSVVQTGNHQLSESDVRVYVENDLKKIIHTQLKINTDLLDTDANFSEFGFDSILLTEFSHRLSQYFSIEILPAILFGHYTLEKLATYLLSECNDAIMQHYIKSHSNGYSQKNQEVPKIKDVYNKQKHLINGNEYLLKPPNDFDENSGNVSHTERVAVIGMSGKLPMANDLNEFWDNLKSGKDCISMLPDDRTSLKENFIANRQYETQVTWGGFIDGIEEFDPEFFGISDREAELMDPGQRLIMTYVYRAIEDAGYSPKSLAGKNVAVFIGIANSGYDSLVEKSGSEIEAYTATGTQPSVGPNRISYYLDLRGPSEPVETACASSLVAIRKGLSALNEGCEMAIVGGVNILLTPTGHIAYDKAGMLSDDGRCKTFSTNANGFVRSEGVGILILKKLHNAEKNGDHIYGLICGSAENHGGRAHSLTTPNPVAQTQLLEKAYREANIDPRTVTYMEAHGTGTRLGDSIEIDALRMAFKSLISGSKDDADSIGEKASLAVNGYCGLGSVKTNIGHTELASGVAGVIKVLLQLKHEMLVRNLNTEPLNPDLQLNGSPFFVVNNAQEWKALSDDSGQPVPRRAGVSSFGMGGVNAHVILEEYIARQEKSDDMQSTQLIVFSAENEKLLETVVRQMLDYVLTHEKMSLTSFAYTLQAGRDQLNVRLAMMVSDRKELLAGLRHFLGVENVACSPVPFTCSGKGKVEVPDAHFIQELIQNKNLEEIGQCWVRGGKISWSLLHRGKIPNRVSLPTYPFDNKSCWVSGPNPPARKVMDIQDVRHARVEGIKLAHMKKIPGSFLFESWRLYG